MQGQGMYRGDGQGGVWHACGTNKLHLLDVQQVSSSDIPFPAKGYAANAFADDHPVARLEFVGSSSRWCCSTLLLVTTTIAERQLHSRFIFAVHDSL